MSEDSLSLLRNNYNTWEAGRQKSGEEIKSSKLRVESSKFKVGGVEGTEMAAGWGRGRREEKDLTQRAQRKSTEVTEKRRQPGGWRSEG
jgi:hypothetical protein